MRTPVWLRLYCSASLDRDDRWCASAPPAAQGAGASRHGLAASAVSAAVAGLITVSAVHDTTPRTMNRF